MTCYDIKYFNMILSIIISEDRFRYKLIRINQCRRSQSKLAISAVVTEAMKYADETPNLEVNMSDRNNDYERERERERDEKRGGKM